VFVSGITVNRLDTQAVESYLGKLSKHGALCTTAYAGKVLKNSFPFSFTCATQRICDSG
jgi:hypothetical protein